MNGKTSESSIAIKKGLRHFVKTYLADGLSPALARSMAVKKLHTKYQYRNNAYSAEDLEKILRKNGALE